MKTDRREFLQSGAALSIGFALPLSGRAAPAAPSNTFAPNAWLRITPDNKITVICGSAEMGQGVLTAIPMLLAEELEADWKLVSVEQAPASAAYNNPLFGMQATGGSTTVRAHWTPVRQAGAAAREMLVAAAAKKWGLPADKLRCRAQPGHRPRRPEDHVWRPGRPRRRAAGAREAPAQVQRGLQDPRQTHAATGHTGQDQWSGPLRHRCAAGRHADCRDGPRAARRHQAQELQRGRSQGYQGRAPGDSHRLRRGRAGRWLLGGQEGSRCIGRGLGHGRQGRAQQRQGLGDAGRRRQQGQCRGAGEGLDQGRRRHAESRVRGALSGPCLHGTAQLSGLGQGRRGRDLGRHAKPGAGPRHPEPGGLGDAGQGQGQHPAAGRRLRSPLRARLHHRCGPAVQDQRPAGQADLCAGRRHGGRLLPPGFAGALRGGAGRHRHAHDAACGMWARRPSWRPRASCRFRPTASTRWR